MAQLCPSLLNVIIQDVMTGKWSLLVIPKAGLSFARMMNGAHSVVIIGKIWNVFLIYLFLQEYKFMIP